MSFQHRDLQASAPPAKRNISAEVAEREHVAEGIERFTELPTAELLKDIDVLKIEGKLAENLEAVYAPLLGALRAARVLRKTDAAEDLRKAFKAITDIQAELARERGEE